MRERARLPIRSSEHLPNNTVAFATTSAMPITTSRDSPAQTSGSLISVPGHRAEMRLLKGARHYPEFSA